MADVEVPESFSFPFEPYDIQQDFMKNLFTVLEEKKLGIFESPTGTGKSLSLICGALTWLHDYMRRFKEALEDAVKQSDDVSEDDDGPDWFSAAAKRRDIVEAGRKARQELSAIKKQRDRIDAMRSRQQSKKSADCKVNTMDVDSLYKDASDIRNNLRKELVVNQDGCISAEEAELIIDDYMSDEDKAEDEERDGEEEKKTCLKIYYCSRTHSQLAQFIREVQKTAFAHNTTVVSLASRQNLCINDPVSRLHTLSLINERCLELQQGKKQATTRITEEGLTSKKRKLASGCPYYKQHLVEGLSEKVLLEVQDMEELVSSGRRSKACPYYATRHAVPEAQLVVLPYQTLLHKGTREASNIRLEGSVVIIDEAHNLLETVANIHSVVVTYSQACGAHAQLSQYKQRYEKKLSAKNLLYIQQILFFIKSLIKALSPTPLGVKLPVNTFTCGILPEGNIPGPGGGKIVTLASFMSQTETYNLSLFKLIRYIEKSKIAHKLNGFSQVFEGTLKEKVEVSQDINKNNMAMYLSKLTSQNKSSLNANRTDDLSASEKKDETECEDVVTGCPLLAVTEFMRALISDTSDSRILICRDSVPKKSFVKYLLLNPAIHFHDIVRHCRAVVVAGGTMHPVAEFRTQLFTSVSASEGRIHEFSCGHVIPEENILPLALCQGPTDVRLDFTFKSRSDPKVMDELGRVLINICTIVPGGVVCFLPSYDYEETVFDHLRKAGTLERLSAKKKVFREPRSAAQGEKVLLEYTKAIQESAIKCTTPGGAVLFSVVGGKMSEGINFSDDLGRCVVMIGMPYPNSQSAELKEKILYLNQNVPAGKDRKSPGALYYENLCFRAVNQSIGRSIRHRSDYASILLLDYRYSQKAAIQSLPGWIGKHVKTCDKFSQAFGMLRTFFAEKKSC